MRKLREKKNLYAKQVVFRNLYTKRGFCLQLAHFTHYAWRKHKNVFTINKNFTPSARVTLGPLEYGSENRWNVESRRAENMRFHSVKNKKIFSCEIIMCYVKMASAERQKKSLPFSRVSPVDSSGRNLRFTVTLGYICHSFGFLRNAVKWQLANPLEVVQL